MQITQKRTVLKKNSLSEQSSVITIKEKSNNNSKKEIKENSQKLSSIEVMIAAQLGFSNGFRNRQIEQAEAEK
jgi:hypothetical protein